MKENIIIVGSGPISREILDRVAATGIGVIVVDTKQTTLSTEPEPIPFKINSCIGDLMTPYKSIINKKTYTKNAPRFKGKR